MPIERPALERDGFTLIELLIFIVIVTVGLVGVLSVLNVTVRGSADPMIHKQMLAIAEGLIEEVSSMPYTFCDPDDPSAATATLSGGAITGCTTQEILGPENNTGSLETRSGTPAFDNVNDYYVAGGLQLNPVTDITGNSNANLAGYTANIQIFAEALSGIASSSTTASAMNVLRVAVTVNHGSDSLALETYRTRHSPNNVP